MSIFFETNKFEFSSELLNDFLKKKRSFFKNETFLLFKKKKYELDVLKKSSLLTCFKNIFFSKKQNGLNSEWFRLD
jgi:hypothetical protein